MKLKLLIRFFFLILFSDFLAADGFDGEHSGWISLFG